MNHHLFLKKIFRGVKRYKNYFEIFLNILFKKPVTFVKTRNNYKISGPGNSDIIGMISEIIFAKRYTCIDDFLIKKGDIIIDVGANIGVFSIFASKNNAEKIIVVEPVDNNIIYIRQNIKADNCLSYFKIYNRPLLGERKNIYLNMNEICNEGSFISDIKNDGSILKESITLEDIIK